MGFFSSLLSKEHKPKKCRCCGKMRMPGVLIGVCEVCKDGVCASCSRNNICELCVRRQESETKDKEEGVAQTQEFYKEEASNNIDTAAKKEVKPACHRCSSTAETLPCMTCEKPCCQKCADAAFVAPFRRCRLCPSPIGGEISFVAAAFQKQNQLRRDQELFSKKKAALELEKECTEKPLRCSESDQPAAKWIEEVAKVDPAAVASVTPYRGRFPIEEECARCRAIIRTRAYSAEVGFCMRCCRTLCGKCSFDSSNCVDGQLLCEICQCRVFNPRAVDQASSLASAFDGASREVVLEAGSVASAILAVNEFTSARDGSFEPNRTLLPSLLASDVRVPFPEVEGDITTTSVNGNEDQQQVLPATSTLEVLISTSAHCVSLSSQSRDFSGNTEFGVCPFAAKWDGGAAVHSFVCTYGTEGFEVDGLIRAVARDPQLFWSVSNNNGGGREVEKKKKKKSATVEEKLRTAVQEECMAQSRRAFDRRLMLLKQLQSMQYPGLARVLGLEEQVGIEHSQWALAASLTKEDRPSSTMNTTVLDYLSSRGSTTPTPTPPLPPFTCEPTTLSVFTALGEAVDLKQYLQQRRDPLPESTIVAIALQVAETLHYLHSGALDTQTLKDYATSGGSMGGGLLLGCPSIHGSITPRNIMICEGSRAILMLPSTLWRTVPPAHQLLQDSLDSEERVDAFVRKCLGHVVPRSDGDVDSAKAGELCALLDRGEAAPFVLEQLEGILERKRCLEPGVPNAYMDSLRLSVIPRREKVALRTGVPVNTTSQKLADFVVRGSTIVKCNPFDPETWVESTSSSISTTVSSSPSSSGGDADTPRAVEQTFLSSNSSAEDPREAAKKYLADDPYGKYDEVDTDTDGAGSEPDAAASTKKGGKKKGKGSRRRMSTGSSTSNLDERAEGGTPHTFEEAAIDPPQPTTVPGFYEHTSDEVQIEYVAPEMRAGRGCVQSDVWSLGVVMFVLAALPEYPLLGREGGVADMGSTFWSKDRLAAAIDYSILENCHSYSPILLALITQMVQHNVSDRPSSGNVVRVLRGMVTSLDTNRVD